MRIVLLLAAYERGGADQAPSNGQRRFCDATVEAYVERLSALEEWAAPRPLVRVGAAPHSVRAVSAGWLERIAAYCEERGLALHIHAGEQPREIEESLAEHGLRPVELLERTGALSKRTTVIHATDCNDVEIDLLASSTASVCICPTTEANLGDGYAPIRQLFEAGVAVCVGSDSNTIIDPFVEMRELEAIARRTARRRNVLVRAGESGPAAYLLDCGWSAGARALGSRAPLIETGAAADLISLDLDHHQIAGVPDEHLAAAIALGGAAALVRRTWVAGLA
jgi:formimidoylglutamate deiminase